MQKNFKELTPEEVSKLEIDEQVKYFNELNIYRADKMLEFKAELKRSNTDEINKQIADLRAEIAADNVAQLKALTSAIEAQGLALNKLMTQSNRVPSVKSIENFLEENKDALANAMNKTVTFKTDVLRSNVTENNLAYSIEGVGQLPTIPTKLFNLFAKGEVGAGSGGVVQYIDQQAVTRNAAWTAESNQKPESAITWILKRVPLETIADTIPVSNQALTDIPYIASEIRNFLLTNLALKIDTDLFSGSGAAPIIKGIYTWATEYVAAAAGIADANIWDLIKKMKTSIMESSDFMPTHILINPADEDLMTLKKDSTNNYIVPSFVRYQGDKMFVHGMEVVVTSRVTADTLLLGDFSKGVIYTQGGVRIDIGLIDKQFVENMVTIRAEQTMGLVVRSVHATAFAKETGIAAALVTLGT
jgi:hypothetical protein